MKIVAFFNNKSGVGKTSLVYHTSWMLSELGVRTVAIDLDPQANLTSMFLPEDRLEELWPDGDHRDTIMGSLRPIDKGIGDVRSPHLEEIRDNLALVPGDLALARFESRLSTAWGQCLDRNEAAFRVVTSFYRATVMAANAAGAEIALLDVGPNLGAINRSALLASDAVVIPLAADLFSLQGLRNLAPNLRDWRREWNDRLDRKPADMEIDLPSGRMQPIGYVVLQHAVRADRPVKAYGRWMARIPEVYATEVRQTDEPAPESVEVDPSCLASLRNYRSLMPLAQDALKPMFLLKAGDGALGGHQSAVQDCYRDFRVLTQRILKEIRSLDELQ